MYSKFGQFIDGKWQASEKKETYDVINPANEEIIGKASKASPKDVDKALSSAEKGFLICLASLVHPSWSQTQSASEAIFSEKLFRHPMHRYVE